MNNRRGLFVSAFALLLMLASNASGAGKPDQKKACVAAHIKAQELNKDSKLLDARSEAASCGRDECPKPVRKACTTLAQEIEAAIPTVTIDVRESNGESASAAEITVDGTVPSDAREGKPLEIDPGTHVFAARLGDRRVESSISVQPGEKLKRVTLTLPSPPRSPPPAAPKAEPNEARKTPVLVYVLGGIGVVGLASFSYFGLHGRSQESDLDSCKPRCDPALRDPIERNYRIADISLVIGVASIGAATWIYLSSKPAKHEGRRRWYVSAAPRQVTLGGGF